MCLFRPARPGADRIYTYHAVPVTGMCIEYQTTELWNNGTRCDEHHFVDYPVVVQ